MDATDAVETLHRIDPGFREICESLYPGLEPREVADQVYGVSKGVSALTKGSPDQADLHVPTTQWRNGRGHTKGRGRRALDKDVISTRFVGKADKHKDHSRAARNVGLATTGIGTGISAVSLPKHLKELPSAMSHARTGPGIGEGVKSTVKAVRQYSKPPGGNALRDGVGALKAGARVARENPRISAALLASATALHTANLGGEGVATYALHSGGKKNPDIQGTRLTKAWEEAVTMIAKAHRAGTISKEEAIELADAVYEDLSKRDWDPRPAKAAAAGAGIGAVGGTLIAGPRRGGTAGALVGAGGGLVGYGAHRGGKPMSDAAEYRRRKVGKAASFGSMGGSATSGNIKLQALKAPAPVKLDGPRLSATHVGVAKPAKSGAGKSGRTSNSGVRKGEALSKDDAPRSATAVPGAPGAGSLDIMGDISKVDEDKRQCFGWCSVVKIDGRDVIDKQNDMIDIEEIEKSAYDFMLTSRKGGDMHRRAADGGVHHAADVIESFVLTPEKIEKMGLPDSVPQGWWIGMKVNDDALWDDVKSGRKTKFSIHGSGQRTEVMVDD